MKNKRCDKINQLQKKQKKTVIKTHKVLPIAVKRLRRTFNVCEAIVQIRISIEAGKKPKKKGRLFSRPSIPSIKLKLFFLEPGTIQN